MVFFLNLLKMTRCRDAAAGAVWQEGCRKEAAVSLAT